MTNMTQQQIETLNTFKLTVLQVFLPYDYVCDNQDDDCNLNSEQVSELLEIMSKVPTIQLTDVSTTGLRVKFISKSEEDVYVFLEIDQIETDKFYCTSLVDQDFSYVSGYM